MCVLLKARVRMRLNCLSEKKTIFAAFQMSTLTYTVRRQQVMVVRAHAEPPPPPPPPIIHFHVQCTYTQHSLLFYFFFFLFLIFKIQRWKKLANISSSSSLPSHYYYYYHLFYEISHVNAQKHSLMKNEQRNFFLIFISQMS